MNVQPSRQLIGKKRESLDDRNLLGYLSYQTYLDGVDGAIADCYAVRSVDDSVAEHCSLVAGEWTYRGILCKVPIIADVRVNACTVHGY